MTFLPQDYKVTQAINPQVGTTAAITSDTISLKHVKRLWIIVDITETAAIGLLLTPQRDVTVAGAASVALVNSVKIWENANTALTDTLVRQTDALNYTSAAAATNKQIVFQIDPASLGGAYDCVNLLTGAVAVTTTISAVFVAEIRYPQATPPSIILD
jgi:hypothetical protein